MPSRTGDFVLLDAGANDACEPYYLAQFAVMGSIYAKEILALDKPRVGILSIGDLVIGTGLVVTLGDLFLPRVQRSRRAPAKPSRANHAVM